KGSEPMRMASGETEIVIDPKHLDRVNDILEDRQVSLDHEDEVELSSTVLDHVDSVIDTVRAINKPESENEPDDDETDEESDDDIDFEYDRDCIDESRGDAIRTLLKEVSELV